MQLTKVYLHLQDSVTNHHWWLRFQGVVLGYFPQELFTNLVSADLIGCGGRTHSPPSKVDPPMGSGFFPDQDYTHACYFRDISFQNAQKRTRL